MVVSVKLNNDVYMPMVGLGTYGTGEKIYDAVVTAIETGYRHIDTAFYYQNEKEIGRALADLIQAGKVKREELFITTKVWNTYRTPERVVQSVRISLQNLKMDYVDLVLVHWPFAFEQEDGLNPEEIANTTVLEQEGYAKFSDTDYLESWRGFEEAVNLGLAKSIGVSNFNSQQLDRLLANCTIKPVVNQVIISIVLSI